MTKWLRDVRGGIGLLVLGAGIGASAFILLDSVQPPDQPSEAGILSLRATYYNSCREAFQDGRSNMRVGDPGYRRELDADGDGLACEPFLRMRR